MRRHSVSTGLLGIMVSFVVLTVLLLIASRIASETFLVFAIALVLAFLVATTWFVIRENRR